MLVVVNRFRLGPQVDADEFRGRLSGARELMATKPGFLGGEIGRNLDEPDLWVLTTRWGNVGGYRRALSSYDGKLHLAPLLGQAINEASAFEVADPDADLNVAIAREA